MTPARPASFSSRLDEHTVKLSTSGEELHCAGVGGCPYPTMAETPMQAMMAVGGWIPASAVEPQQHRQPYLQPRSSSHGQVEAVDTGHHAGAQGAGGMWLKGAGVTAVGSASWIRWSCGGGRGGGWEEAEGVGPAAGEEEGRVVAAPSSWCGSGGSDSRGRQMKVEEG